MDFKYYLPTRIVFGLNCVLKEKELVKGLGNRALVVTGKSSARVSGALDDVSKALNSLKIDYEVFSGVDSNPTFANVVEGATQARNANAELIIGIGGGSPLDAAKAIALLVTNPGPVERLFQGPLENPALPVIALPTTAGTGSEVTPYSILTYEALETKKSFASPSIIPRVAFLDARYTTTLPHSVTVDTALDALSHALEGYLANRANPISDTLAGEALRLLGKQLDNLGKGELRFEDREQLLYASLLAGMVIAQTGTTVIHSLGYSLTYFKNIPHGRANAFFIEAFLDYNREHLGAWPKLDHILDLLQLTSITELGEVLRHLIGKGPGCSGKELSKFAHIAIQSKSIANCPMVPSENDLISIIRNALEVQI